MNKEQFRLRIYNNRYIRGVIVAICKIIIWSLIYALILGLSVSVLSSEVSPNAFNGYSNPFNPGTIFISLIIIAVTVAYYWVVITEVLQKIKQNKQLTQLEDEYLNHNGGKSLEE